ncbi:MAG: Trypsin, partial [Myxococcaceae bacterium]|nr:Trypsin [Myxococcaceae bacterium]
MSPRVNRSQSYPSLASFTLLAAVAVRPSPTRAEAHLITQAIVGGREVADTGASPTAMLSTCSATLLAPDLLVTAAHCLLDQPGEARFGTAGVPVPLRRCMAHPEYGAADGHDIAYCLLASAVPHATASVISRCESDELRAGTGATLAGYGYVNNTQRGDRTERMVSV